MITPKYVTVRGTMEVNWTVELPVEHCRESVACDDPAVDLFDFGFGDAMHKRAGDSRQWSEASIFIFAPRPFPVFVNLILSATLAFNFLTQQLVTRLGIYNLAQRYRRKRILKKFKE